MQYLFLPIYLKKFQKKNYQLITEEYFIDLYSLNKDNFLIENLSYNKKKFYDNYKFIKKKTSLYKKQILNQFLKNKKLNYIKYYDSAIEFWLIHFLSCIKIRYDKLSEIKKKYKKLSVPKIFFHKFSFDRTSDFLSFFRNDSVNNIYIYQEIAKIIGISQININEKIPRAKIQNKYQSNTIKNKILLKLIKFNKPNLGIDIYNKSKKLKFFNIFLKNDFELSSDFLKSFYRRSNNKIKIKIKETNQFDIIVNRFISEFFPKILIPNLYLVSDLEKIKKNIKSLQSSIGIISSDEYRILSSMLKKNKVISYQHGATYEMTKCNVIEEFEKKFSTFKNWKNYKSFQLFYKNISENNKINNNEEIIFFTSINYLNGLRYEHNKVNFKTNKDQIKKVWEFYNCLTNKLKKKLILRNQQHTYGWNYKKVFKSFNDNQVLPKFDNSKSAIKSINNSRIFVTDFLSTSFFEALICNIPCFSYFKIEDYCFNKETYDLIVKLKKRNIIFENPKECAKFISKNYDTIEMFWYDNKTQRDLNKFKKKFFI